jgi:uncharacterized protein (DUF305 family)
MKSLASLLSRFALAGFFLSCFLPSAWSDAPAPDRSQARFEENFLTDMIDHHRAGVALADLAAERATRPELRALAGMMQTTQQAELEKMEAWLEEWYGTAYEAETSARAEARREALGELEGEAFDREFMIEMALHHADALDAAQAALLRGYHADLIELAGNLQAVQADELALFRIWLNQWHGITELTPQDRGIAATRPASPVAKGDEPVVPVPPRPAPGVPDAETPPPATAPSAVTTPPGSDTGTTTTSGTSVTTPPTTVNGATTTGGTTTSTGTNGG